MIYLLNSPVLSAYGVFRLSALDEARLRKKDLSGAVSAIGHEGAAELLSELLHRAVPVARQQVQMQPGDSALVLRLLRRLPEGQVLTREQLRKWPHELAWLERVQ